MAHLNDPTRRHSTAVQLEAWSLLQKAEPALCKRSLNDPDLLEAWADCCDAVLFDEAREALEVTDV